MHIPCFLPPPSQWWAPRVILTFGCHKYCCKEHPKTCSLMYLFETSGGGKEIYTQEWTCWVIGCLQNGCWSLTPSMKSMTVSTLLLTLCSCNAQLSLFFQSKTNQILSHYCFNLTLHVFIGLFHFLLYKVLWLLFCWCSCFFALFVCKSSLYRLGINSLLVLNVASVFFHDLSPHYVHCILYWI